jgi:hypothetical protein
MSSMAFFFFGAGLEGPASVPASAAAAASRFSGPAEAEAGRGGAGELPAAEGASGA